MSVFKYLVIREVSVRGIEETKITLESHKKYKPAFESYQKSDKTEVQCLLTKIILYKGEEKGRRKNAPIV